MFSPIIHNLSENHPAYKACQHYNSLIANKPKGADMTLDQKIEAQRLWQAQCEDARNTVRKLMEGETSPEYAQALEVSREATKKFGIATQAYRNRIIGDSEYLEARRIYDQAQIAFDKAYDIEQAKGD